MAAASSEFVSSPSHGRDDELFVYAEIAHGHSMAIRGWSGMVLVEWCAIAPVRRRLWLSEGAWLTDIYEILRVAGPWGGPVLVMGFLYARGHLATGRELQQVKEQLAELRKERETERADLKREIAFWRDIAVSTSRIADQVVGALPPRAG